MKTTGSSIYLQAVLNDPRPFTESADRALDGTAYYAMASVCTTFAPLHIYCIPDPREGPRFDMADRHVARCAPTVQPEWSTQ